MSFDRTLLPDPATYYQERGLKLTGPRSSHWRTAPCAFHGSRKTMRINIYSGAFVCMGGCGARGGDVVAYEMAVAGIDFVDAAKALGAWIDDGKPAPKRPTPLHARDALHLLSSEANLVAVAAGNFAKGIILTDQDRARLMVAAGRISQIAGMFP